MSQELRFDGKVAIVTGAGGGLGRAHALLLARRGASVVVNDLGGATDGTGGSGSMADAVVEEITAAGGKAVASYDSVATAEGGGAIVDAATEAFGRVDIVVNNAGILRDRSFLKLSQDDIAAVMAVHLRGAFNVTQPAFAKMKAQGFGRIVFTSSSAGLFGNFGQANYGAAKMGLVGLSNVLAIEGAKYDIRSNVIAPVARTRMTEGLLGPLADALDPEHVSPLVAWLCHESCEETHGVFSVGGGRFARVQVQLARGWMTREVATPEQVRDQMGAISDMDGAIVPSQVMDELQLFGAMLKAL